MKTSWSWGPLYLRWQNLAHDHQWDRVRDVMRQALAEHFDLDVHTEWERAQRITLALHDAIDGKMGSLWHEGRAWLKIFPSAEDRAEGEGELCQITIEWHLLKRQSSWGWLITFDPDSEDAISTSLRIPGAGLYLSVELPSRRSRTMRSWATGGRELGVRFFDGSLWLSLWSTPNDCDYRAPFSNPSSRKRQPVWHLDTFFLGKETHTRQEVERGDGTLYLNGADDPDSERHEVTWVREIMTWRRPRWPWPTTLSRVTIECESGIPIPGKGENGWDCDDDAIYSSTGPAASIEEYAQKLIADVKKKRLERGGKNWRPTK